MLHAFLISPMRATCSAHLIFLTIFGEACKLLFIACYSHQARL
jgi:hypothetical protein